MSNLCFPLQQKALPQSLSFLPIPDSNHAWQEKTNPEETFQSARMMLQRHFPFLKSLSFLIQKLIHSTENVFHCPLHGATSISVCYWINASSTKFVFRIIIRKKKGHLHFEVVIQRAVITQFCLWYKLYLIFKCCWIGKKLTIVILQFFEESCFKTNHSFRHLIFWY